MNLETQKRNYKVIAFEKAMRGSLRRILPKLLVVLVVVAAYFVLHALDVAKQRFNAPIEITDSSIDNLKLILSSGGRAEPVTSQRFNGAQLQAPGSLLEDVDRIKYRKFKDDDELIEALKEDLFIEKAFKLRTIERAQENLSRAYVERQLDLETKRKAEEDRKTKLEANSEADLTDAETSRLAEIKALNDENLNASNNISNDSHASVNRPPLVQARIDRTFQGLEQEIDKRYEGIERSIKENLKKSLAEYNRNHEKNLRLIDAELKDSTAGFEHQLSVLNNDARALDTEADSRISRIYGQLSPNLAKISTKAPIIPEPSLNAFLENALNDKNNLYVIYEIFRITCIIILIFSVVFVLAMVLRTLPFSEGADLLTEQAKALLARGESSIPGAVKTAVISIAALGVGTAAIAAGVAINDKADRALDSSSSSSTYTLSQASNRSTLRLLSREIRETIDTQRNEDRPIFITTPSPSVVTGSTVVKVIPIGDPSNGAAVANSIGTLTKRVESLRSELSNIRTDAQGIDGRIWTRIQPDVQKVNEELSGVNKVLQEIPSLISKGDQHVTDILLGVNSTLGNLNRTVEQMRKEGLGQPPPPDGRNMFTRASQLFGGEIYAISGSSYNSLSTFLQRPEDELIRDSLAKMLGELPGDKQTFLKSLNDKILASPTGDKTVALKRLKMWQALILRYARVPR